MDKDKHIKTKANAYNPHLLPDFCDNRVILIVILIAELLAIVLTLPKMQPGFDWLSYLGYCSLFVQGTALLDASLLCYLKKYFESLKPNHRALLIYFLLQLVTLATTFISFPILEYSQAGPDWKSTVLLQNIGISAIISAVAMRYFYVRHQWELRLEAENLARIEALQARIRPHFLFNSMNTIASLVHDDPNKAETAVLDLADLFRSTLTDVNSISLAEEIDITRRYLRIEALRLGERLSVAWELAETNATVRVPALIIQPLVENAIYHGIEPLAEGGTITIGSKLDGEHINVFIKNPFRAKNTPKHGNQIALNNIRQRLALAYHGQAELNILHDEGQHEVNLKIPMHSPEAE